MPMYDATLAETVTIRGYGGDEIEAYLARPMSPGPPRRLIRHDLRRH